MGRFYPKKITTAACGLEVATLEQVAASSKKPTPVLRVAGSLSSAQAEQSQFGNYIRFQGEFAAINLLTGDEYRSRTLIVPAVAEMPLEELLNGADGASVEVMVDIGVEANVSAKGGTKFRWTAQPLHESKEDRLSQLMSSKPLPRSLAATETAAKESKAKK